MPQKRILLVGDYRHGDFRDAEAWLRANTHLTAATTIAEALSQLAAGPPPEVILIAQARPGRFHQRQIEQLHAACPVSRLIALLGAWCEGETRSGRPWPGVLRVYWHQWNSRFIPELSAEPPVRAGVWELPRTATAGERLLPTAQVQGPRRSGLIAIQTSAWTMFESLSDACRWAGYATAWLAPSQPPQLHGVSAVIWDAVGCRDQEIHELQELAARYRPARVVAMLDFLRLSDHDRALAAGATAVLAKPFLVSDLLLQLELRDLAHAPLTPRNTP